MFDFRDYYRSENESVTENYRESLEAIRTICQETSGSNHNGKMEYRRFFHAIGTHILQMAKLEERLTEDYFNTTPLAELQSENQPLYSELYPANYQRSYADPRHCVTLFGERFGPLLATVYQRFRQLIPFAFQHEQFHMVEWNRLFIAAWEYVSQQKIQYAELRDLLTVVLRDHSVERQLRQLRQRHDPLWQPWHDIVTGCKLEELRYLFRYGTPITENELRTARFLLEYPPDKLRGLAEQIATAFLTGFVSDNKKRGERNIVTVAFEAGQEPLLRFLLDALRQRDLQPIVMHPGFTPVNRQYYYDHRNQLALWMSEEGIRESEECYASACEQQAELLQRFAGSIYLDVFGEPPFSPEVKKECPEFSGEQRKLISEHHYRRSQISERYKPRESTSFCMIAFPSPLIGPRYEDIFTDIMRVNMLDTVEYEQIQQKIIDNLDQA
ncbi:hypothetical protein H8D51_00190, partial [bacterium]|nr:hypothetical protein [bacterium]